MSRWIIIKKDQNVELLWTTQGALFMEFSIKLMLLWEHCIYVYID